MEAGGKDGDGGAELGDMAGAIGALHRKGKVAGLGWCAGKIELAVNAGEDGSGETRGQGAGEDGPGDGFRGAREREPALVVDADLAGMKVVDELSAGEREISGGGELGCAGVLNGDTEGKAAEGRVGRSAQQAPGGKGQVGSAAGGPGIGGGATGGYQLHGVGGAGCRVWAARWW